MDIFYIIEQNYSKLSDNEKKIADYILQKNIKNMSIVELAKLTNTSTSGITRFSKKIECDSFVDMKMKLSLAAKDTKKVEDDLFSSVYNYYVDSIERTKQLLDKKIISTVITEIKKATKIYIYGVGSSGMSASEVTLRLIRMGFNVHAITDSHMMIMNSAIVQKSDLVIGLSVSGETKEIVNALRISQQSGAKTIGVTSFKESEIGNYSDILIPVYTSQFINNKRFINTQFSVMYLFDLISMILLSDDELNKKMQRTIDVILK